MPSCRHGVVPSCRNASSLSFLHRDALAKAIRCCSTQASADNNAIEMTTAEHMIERHGGLAARLRGRATARMGTDEIMQLTRGE